ncbi:MAG: hypothetical protein HC888_06010 [Candidatus Competibacteraceae bacterium]|nr:hypothetical protein [Candidatus Competibacteraceae bacterium]
MECQGLDGILKDVYKNYGENLKVLSLDVDDQANEVWSSTSTQDRFHPLSF